MFNVLVILLIIGVFCLGYFITGKIDQFMKRR